MIVLKPKYTLKTHSDFRYPVLSVLLLLISAGLVFAQTVVNSFENERLKLENELDYTGTLIDKTRAAKSITLNDLALLQSSISNRERLIEIYRMEQHQLYDTIFSKLLHINDLNEEINSLKEEYARMIYAVYKQGGNHQYLLYVFAAGNLSQAFSRLNWFRSYITNRKEHTESISSLEELYLAEVNLMEDKVNQNDLLLKELVAEKQKLDEEQLLKHESVAILGKREKELMKKYNELSENHKHLKSIIEKSLAEDLVNNTEGNTENNSKYEEHQLSGNFKNNLGKLPWPAEIGVVVSLFGEHQHPDLKAVKIKNNGINIITGEGSKARAVFDGVVTRVMDVSNFHKVVILRHGEYLTVYSNLADVSVKRGDVVKTLHEVGIIYTDAANARTELHFELWQGKVQLDPLLWLINQQYTGQSIIYQP